MVFKKIRTRIFRKAPGSQHGQCILVHLSTRMAALYEFLAFELSRRSNGFEWWGETIQKNSALPSAIERQDGGKS